MIKYRRHIVFIILFLSVGCASISTVVPFQDAGIGKNSPTRPEQIRIYRRARPFPSFTELGVIKFEADRFDLEYIYNKLRTDSAEHGAEAIIDLKIKENTALRPEEIEECSPTVVCDAENKCVTKDVCTKMTVQKQKTFFVIQGSMIRRKP